MGAQPSQTDVTILLSWPQSSLVLRHRRYSALYQLGNRGRDSDGEPRCPAAADECRTPEGKPARRMG
jgi:hypothetical protein